MCIGSDIGRHRNIRRSTSNSYFCHMIYRTTNISYCVFPSADTKHPHFDGFFCVAPITHDMVRAHVQQEYPHFVCVVFWCICFVCECYFGPQILSSLTGASPGCPLRRWSIFCPTTVFRRKSKLNRVYIFFLPPPAPPTLPPSPLAGGRGGASWSRARPDSSQYIACMSTKHWDLVAKHVLSICR